MTDPTKTAIALVLDRSGSMDSNRRGYQDMLDDFVNEQRQLGDCDFTLVQFDTAVETVHLDVPIGDVPPIELRPRGRTALFDAVGATITLLGETLAAKEEGDRPGKVLVVILTDGWENASVDWDITRLRAKIDEQQTRWSWEFLYLSADLKAPEQARTMGLRRDTVSVYAADYAGTQVAGQHVNSSVSNWRRGPGGQSISIDPGLTEEKKD